MITDAITPYAPELVGFLLPPIIELFNLKSVSNPAKDKQRFIISLCLCFIIACLLKWNAFIYRSPEEIIKSFSILFVESQTVYRLYFKDSIIRQTIHNKLVKKIEPIG